MTLSPWIIYLWGTVDQIGRTAEILSCSLGALLFLALIASAADAGNELGIRGSIEKAFKKLVSAFVSCLLLVAFLPSSKTIALMAVAPAIVGSKMIQEDLPELYEIAVEALKEQLKPEEKK